MSVDDGLHWSDYAEADHAGGPDQADSILTGLVATNGLAGIVGACLHARSGRSFETYVNRAFGPSWQWNDERALGPYGEVDNRCNDLSPVVMAPNATDVDRLCRKTNLGQLSNICYARSVSSGDTHGTPIRLSQHPEGTEFTFGIALARHPTDGNRVYAVCTRRSFELNRRQLAFRRSSDRGAGWTPKVVVTLPADMCTPRMVVNSADDVFILYGIDVTDLEMNVSRDDGTTWGAGIDFDQQVIGNSVINDPPVMCVPGTTNIGVAASADFRDVSLTRTWTNQFNGTSWLGEGQLSTQQTRKQLVPRGACAFDEASVLPSVVIFTDNCDAYAHCSTDFGTTFGAALRIDEIAPQPIAFSRIACLANDGGPTCGPSGRTPARETPRSLRSSGGFGGASGLVNNDTDTPRDDARGAPAAGAEAYYLVRAQHTCGGTYGDSRAAPRSSRHAGRRRAMPVARRGSRGEDVDPPFTLTLPTAARTRRIER